MPFFGGTIANIGGAVQGTLSHTLSGITSRIGSAASGAAGAILSGVNSISNTIYHTRRRGRVRYRKPAGRSRATSTSWATR